MAKSIDERFASMTEFAQALADYGMSPLQERGETAAAVPGAPADGEPLREAPGDGLPISRGSTGKRQLFDFLAKDWVRQSLVSAAAVILAVIALETRRARTNDPDSQASASRECA